MVAMILSSVSLFTFSQEEPPAVNEQTEEQVTVEDTQTESVASPQETPSVEQEEPLSQQEETTEDVQVEAQEEITTAPITEPTEETQSTEQEDTPSEQPESSPEESVEALEDTQETETIPQEETTQEEPLPAETAEPSPAELRVEGDTVTIEGDTLSIEIPSVPAEPTPPVEEEAIVIPEDTSDPEPTGIDTVSLENPQGNWLFKRIWWERAEERYEKIRLLVDNVWQFRTQFFIKRNNLDRTVLDPFYINIGIDQGELQVRLAEINEFLEKQREQQGDLSEEERILYETYVTDEETLKQLKLDVESISKLDNAIDDALIRLMDQINRVRQYEAQAWDNFKEIAHILNDTRARELYYMIEGAARNIKNISVYLEQEFFTHFDKLVADATKHVARVQNQIEALKEKGISFQRQAELLEQKAQQVEDDEDDEDENVKPKPKLGWFAWIGSLFSSAFDYIVSIIRLPYDMIFGK